MRTVDLFTCMTPIVDGAADGLRARLAALPLGEDSPLARVPGTHTARWVVLTELGTGRPGSRRRLDPAQLMFSAVVDGPVDRWLLGLRGGLGPVADEIWAHCYRWPGITSDGWDRWFLDHRIRHTLPFVAAGNATVDDVVAGLEAREKLAELVVAAQDLEPADLRRAYEQTFGPVARVRR